MEAQPIRLGGTALVPETPVKEGYIFGGWYTSADCKDGEEFDFATVINEDITVYAKWTKVPQVIDPDTGAEVIYYVVTLQTNGGNAVAGVAVENGKRLNENDLQIPTRTGYIFSGWYTNAKCTVEYNFNQPVVSDITLYAKWTKQTFTVTFYDTLGGEHNEPLIKEIVHSTVEYNDYAVNPTTPIKYGYRFAGWFTDPDCTNRYDFDTPVTSDLDLYVKWAMNPVGVGDDQTFTVTFETFGGSVVVGQAVKKGERASNSTTPTKRGYVFLGWYEDIDCTVEFDFNTPILDDTIIYAKWQVIRVTVSFVQGTMTQQRELDYGQAIAAPETPVREGYTFAGWYLDEELLLRFDFDTKITGDLVLYAKFNINTYNVTFRTNGGSEIEGQKVVYGNKAVRPETDPTREHYVFDGWYADPSLTTLYNFEKPVSNTTYIYAKWKAVTYTVEFVTNVEGLSVAAQTVASGVCAVAPSTPTRDDGFVFVGWYLDEKGTTKFDFSTPIEQDTVLYAKWAGVVEDAIAVTFDSMGGSPVAGQSVKYGKTVQKPTVDPTKEHYTFTGWYTDIGCTQAYDFATVVTEETGNLTLYAGWQIKVYTVTLNVNGGELPANAESKQSVVSGGKVTPVMPTKMGYTFDGWYTDAECLNGYDFDTLVEKNFTLYAKWTPVPTTDPDDPTQEVHYIVVTFETFGGSLIAQQVIKEGEQVKVPEMPAKANHIFRGWYKDASLLSEYQFRTPVYGEDFTLYAAWDKIEYTVTFDSQGGTDVESQLVANGESAKVPVAPTKHGHLFEGWFVSTEENAEAYTFGAVEGNITVYAKWTRVPTTDPDGNPATYYIVSFQTNGGSVIADAAVKENDTVAEPAAPTREGWTFGGWYQNAELTAEFDFNTPITENTVLYAKWTGGMFTVTFANCEMADQKPEAIEVEYGSRIETPKNLTSQDASFIGWCIDAACTVVFDADTKITAHTTLYAKWKAKIVYVDFVVNGKTIHSPVESGKTVQKPSVPALEGQKFVGWYEDQAFTKAFDFETKIRGEENQVAYTLYAKYEYRKYNVAVSYDAEKVTVAGITAGEYAFGTVFTATVTKADAAGDYTLRVYLITKDGKTLVELDADDAYTFTVGGDTEIMVTVVTVSGEVTDEGGRTEIETRPDGSSTEINTKVETVENGDGTLTRTTTTTTTEKDKDGNPTGEATKVVKTEIIDKETGTTETEITVTVEIKPDGTKVTTTVEKRPDGTSTTTIVEERPDGSSTTTVIEKDKDGNVTHTTVTEKKPDGSSSSTTTDTSKPDYSKTESTTETEDEDGNVTKVNTIVEHEVRKTVDKNGNVTVTVIDKTTVITTVTDAMGNLVSETQSSVTTVKSETVDKDGNFVKEIVKTTTVEENGDETIVEAVTTPTEGVENSRTTIITTTYPDGRVEVRKIVTKIEVNGDTTIKTETEYDENGNPIKETVTVTTKNPDGSTSSTTTETEFDEDGNRKDPVVTDKTESSSGTESTKTETEYDEEGNVIQTTETLTIKDEDGKIVKVIVTVKNGDGKIIKVTETEYNKNEQIVKETITEYDEKGNVISKIVEVYTYDQYDEQDTKTVTETTVTKNPDGTTTTTTVVKVYDRNGNLISEKTTETITGEDGLKDKETVTDKVIDPETGNWTETKTETVYDENGNPIDTTVTDKETDVTDSKETESTDTQTETEVDGEGNMIRERRTETTTTKDEKGRKVKEVITVYLTENNVESVESITVKTYTYDGETLVKLVIRVYNGEGKLIEETTHEYSKEIDPETGKELDVDHEHKIEIDPETGDKTETDTTTKTDPETGDKTTESTTKHPDGSTTETETTEKTDPETGDKTTTTDTTEKDPDGNVTGGSTTETVTKPDGSTSTETTDKVTGDKTTTTTTTEDIVEDGKVVGTRVIETTVYSDGTTVIRYTETITTDNGDGTKTVTVKTWATYGDGSIKEEEKITITIIGEKVEGGEVDVDKKDETTTETTRPDGKPVTTHTTTETSKFSQTIDGTTYNFVKTVVTVYDQDENVVSRTVTLEKYGTNNTLVSTLVTEYGEGGYAFIKSTETILDIKTDFPSEGGTVTIKTETVIVTLADGTVIKTVTVLETVVDKDGNTIQETETVTETTTNPDGTTNETETKTEVEIDPVTGDKTTTITTKNPDSQTTTTTKTEESGEVEFDKETSTTPEGSTETSKKTVTHEDGSTTTTITVIEKDKDGNVIRTTETVEERSAPESEGEEGKLTQVTVTVKDGDGKILSVTVTYYEDGKPVKKEETVYDKDGNATVTETIIKETNPDKDVTTETTDNGDGTTTTTTVETIVEKSDETSVDTDNGDGTYTKTTTWTEKTTIITTTVTNPGEITTVTTVTSEKVVKVEEIFNKSTGESTGDKTTTETETTTTTEKKPDGTTTETETKTETVTKEPEGTKTETTTETTKNPDGSTTETTTTTTDRKSVV